jgi:type IV fimbrial biogenesis protein FimT
MPSHAFTLPQQGVRMRMRGVTLVELVVTLAVFAILVSIAAPSFVQMIAANRITNQTNELIAALNTAKSEAITRGTPATMRARDDANPNEFHRGVQVFTDANSDGEAADPATVIDGTLLRTVDAAAGTTTIVRSTRTGTAPNFTYPAATSSLASRQFITFSPRGGLTSSGTAFFRVCDSSSRTTPGRIVQVNQVGRVSVESTTEDCNT